MKVEGNDDAGFDPLTVVPANVPNVDGPVPAAFEVAA
jgi:hypothetical protein